MSSLHFRPGGLRFGIGFSSDRNLLLSHDRSVWKAAACGLGRDPGRARLHSPGVQFSGPSQGVVATRTEVFGLSTQSTEYQREVVDRVHLPFEMLSDAGFALCDALRLPTFEVDGVRLLKRLTMIVRDGRMEHVIYPVFPPNESADQVLRWLRDHPIEG